MSNLQTKSSEIENVVPINADFQSFKFFMEWSNKLQNTDGFASLHNMVLEAVKNKSPYNHSWIFVTDPENSDETYLISSIGDKKETFLENCPRLNMSSDPMLLEIKESHQPVIVEDARTDARTNKEIVAVNGNVTIVNIPIMLTGELVGCLGAGSFGNEEVDPPSQETIDFLELLSNYVAPVIVRILENEKRERYTAALLKAKLAAEKSNQIKTEFIENVTHELRTPLHAINGFAQLLELESDDFSEEQRQYVNDISNANTRLLSLVENVLDFSSSESGNMEVNYSSVDIPELLGVAIDEVKVAAEKKNLTITSNFDDLIGDCINTDKKRLKQVVSNLLNNAVEFNRENGSVEIIAETEMETLIRISIKDSGIGIPKNKFDILFSPFSRINKNADTLGAGISLVISKQLVEILGGELNFESEENVGSNFWFEIPSNTE